MSYLVDTCIISEMIKPQPEPSVLSWWDNSINSQIYISSLSIGELHYGIYRLPDGKKKEDLLTHFQQIIAAFSGRILPIVDKTCIIWGQMRANAESKGNQLPVVDGLLAATAQEYDLIFVTRNTKDVNITGIKILNPWIEK